MRITKHSPFAGAIIVVKNGAPLGLVQEIDTKKRTYRKVVFPSPYGFVHETEMPEETGHYDVAVMCPKEHDVPESIVKEYQEAGIGMLTEFELELFRKAIGVRV